MYRFFGRWMKVDHQGMADVPGRGRLRHGLRHRHRGRPARHHRPARHPVPALVLDHVPAHPLHRRDVAHGHPRRLLHERRLRLGVLQPGPQGLLQPGHHRTVGGICFFIGTIEVLGLLPHGAPHPRRRSGTSWRLQHQHRRLRHRRHVRRSPGPSPSPSGTSATSRRSGRPAQPITRTSRRRPPRSSSRRGRADPASEQGRRPRFREPDTALGRGVRPRPTVGASAPRPPSPSLPRRRRSGAW